MNPNDPPFEFYREPSSEEMERERIRFEELMDYVQGHSDTVRGWLSDHTNNWRPVHVARPMTEREIAEGKMELARMKMERLASKRKIIPAVWKDCSHCNGKGHFGILRRVDCKQCNGNGGEYK